MDFVAHHCWKDAALGLTWKMSGRGRLIIVALALLAWAGPSAGFAQDGGGANGQAGPPAAGPPAGQPGEEERRVITPQTDPAEQYNLPPNFDPEYRPKRTPRSTKVTIDFRQAQLEEVVKFFSGVLNRNFIISDSIKTNKTITIISPEAVTLNEAYQAFLAALQMNGLTIVPMGNFLKIVESKGAIVEPQDPYEQGERIPNEARVVTALVPVKNADIAQVQEVITKFATPDAQIQPYGNTLIITEYASNLRRLRELIGRLDRGEAADRVYVYKVMYADATEIAQKLQEIFGSGGGASAPAPPARRNQRPARRPAANEAANESAVGEELKVEITEIIADERTNQLIIVAARRSFDEIREMIEILDVPTAVGGQIHVKFLEYADAEELSSTLSSLTQGGQRGQNAQTRAAAARAARRGGPPQQQPDGNVAELLSGEVQITAHTPTNALVVVASPRDFLALENVVDLLDRPRRQVYVEAVIMEIGLDANRTLKKGFNLGAPADLEGVVPSSAVEDGLIEDTQGVVVGQSNYPGLSSLLQTFTGGTGGSLGLIGPGIELPGLGISLPAFAFLLQATQTDNAVNILSTPAILTMDNEEAEIVVGERVPFLRGLAAGAGGGGLGSLAGLAGLAGAQGGEGAAGLGGLGGLGGLAGLTGLGGLVSPIDYEDVGITLRILPQINESNYVKLEVDQEVSDIKGAGGLGAGAPIRTRRNAKTVVLVKDQSTIVIGGLMRDVENETVEKVPFLGDIPLVGFLFRNTSSIKTKQNLVLMLTPYIIENENDLQKIRTRKMEEREELLKLFGRRDLRYMKLVNYQKKSGLLDRMRGQISESVADRDARQEALEAFEQEGPRYRIMGGGEPEPNQVMEIDEVEEPVMLPSPAAEEPAEDGQ